MTTEPAGTTGAGTLDPNDLRDSVRDFRNPQTTAAEARVIVEWWNEHGIPNQFAAMLRAAEIEHAALGGSSASTGGEH
jgi:hypothetical protein